MRLLVIILFASCVLAEQQQISKAADKKVEAKKESKISVDEEKAKSKTGKRDSADQTRSFGLNSNDAPFKPMLNSPTPFVAAASDTQQVYYNKNQVTVGESVGNAKVATNNQAANAYRAQYTQLAQQQQQNKNHLRVNAKNVVVQQQQHQQQQQQTQLQQQPNTQPNILYAAPQNPAYHYERIPQQPQQQQQQLQLPAPLLPSLPQQRGGQQKPTQYLIAIPITYLRQLQQQLTHQQQQQQQQEQAPHLQVFKTQQQPQPQLQQQQIQAVPIYSVAGPLARDNQGSYRPFHRFAPTTASNEISAGGQQSGGQVPAAPGPPGYVTQYVQIPASVLLAAMQSPYVQQQLQQLRPVPAPAPQQLYQQQPQQVQQPQHSVQLQQPQIQLQLQQPIQQQLVQSPAPQFYYYQPQQQQHQQQQLQLKQTQPLAGLASPPVYAYHVNPVQQQQLQQPSQQLPTYQHLTEQQQVNDGKQIHRARGIRPTAIAPPTHQQYDPSVEAYESEEKAQFVQLHAPLHLHTHSHTNAQNQQYISQAQAQAQTAAPIARQQAPAPAPVQHQLVGAHQTPASYEHVVHYNPQYVQHYQAQQPAPRQPHRLQIQSHQQTPFAEHLNNFQFSQGIQGPTSLPFLRLSAAAGETSLHNINMATPQTIIPPFVSGGFQPSFAPLGMPSKVTSFTNVLLQPFVGHSSAVPTTEITAAAGGGAGALPYLHSSGGIRYGTHLYHPPTSAATILNINKQLSPAAHPGEVKVSAASPKSSASPVVVGTPTIVKYP